jgi:E3 ubiquitin-protein ligase synoviolin
MYVFINGIETTFRRKMSPPSFTKFARPTFFENFFFSLVQIRQKQTRTETTTKRKRTPSLSFSLSLDAGGAEKVSLAQRRRETMPRVLSRSFSYVTTSILVASIIVLHALITREQYFSAMLYLSTSKISVVALANVAFALAFTLAKVVKKIFLGTLRDSEVERLQDRTREAVMETCLAMTIFREEFNLRFVSLFASLLFLKAFHGLCKDRAEHMETAPRVRVIDRARILSFMVCLLLVDVAFVKFAIERVVAKGPSVVLLFGFEHVILASKMCVGFAKYFVTLVDRAMDGNWQGKGAFVFYLELCADLVHLCVYVAFFSIIFAYYGLPIHLLRDVYVTFRQFKDRVAAFLRYRRVTANLDSRFPDATAEDLDASQGGEDTCVVCREKMKMCQTHADGSQTPIPKQMRAKKLPCSHAFHLHCLRSWLERQQACPTCRASVLPEEERELERRQREREEGQWQRLPPELQPGYIAPEVQARLDAQAAEARREREERARREREANGDVGAGSTDDGGRAGGGTDAPSSSSTPPTVTTAIAGADAEAQRVREQRLERLGSLSGGEQQQQQQQQHQQRQTPSATNTTASSSREQAATPTPARTPPAPRFVQQQQQQQETRATPPPNMTTPVAPSPSANLNPGSEWWTPGTAAINASYQAGISAAATNVANDEASLSEEDISARRMAHAAAAAVAAAAQQAQMAFMSVAPLGLLPPGSHMNGGNAGYFPFPIDSQYQREQPMPLTPEQYEKEYNRRQEQMDKDARANEKIAVLEQKVNELMRKLEDQQQQQSKPLPPLEAKFDQTAKTTTTTPSSVSSQQSEDTRKVAFRHSRSASPSIVAPTPPTTTTNVAASEIKEEETKERANDDESAPSSSALEAVEDRRPNEEVREEEEEEVQEREDEVSAALRLRRERWLVQQRDRPQN